MLLAPDMLILTRIAALVAVDAPAVSYLAHIGPALNEHLTACQLQDVLMAIAPIVGTARVTSAATHLTEALGVAIAVAESDTGSRGGKEPKPPLEAAHVPVSVCQPGSTVGGVLSSALRQDG